jgi:hypothetical protein
MSWQIFPARLTELTQGSDKAVPRGAMAALMQMHKIDIAATSADNLCGIAGVTKCAFCHRFASRGALASRWRRIGWKRRTRCSLPIIAMAGTTVRETYLTYLVIRSAAAQSLQSGAAQPYYRAWDFVGLGPPSGESRVCTSADIPIVRPDSGLVGAEYPCSVMPYGIKSPKK